VHGPSEDVSRIVITPKEKEAALERCVGLLDSQLGHHSGCTGNNWKGKVGGDMDEKILDSAIQAAKHAADRAIDFKPETYGTVLFFELMHRSVSSITPTPRLLPSTETNVTRMQKRYSASEFFSSVTFGTEVDKVVLCGYFLETNEGMEGYTIDEIKACFLSAKVQAPNNVNLALLQAVKKGFMMETKSNDRSRKSWTLTQTGLQYAESMRTRK
jgi:hypothetical protein